LPVSPSRSEPPRWHRAGCRRGELAGSGRSQCAAEVGDRYEEAETLIHLGDTRHAAGELALARDTWQQALAIFEDIQHPDAGQVRAKLASTNDRASRDPSA
jgi:hypothetical protein